MNPLGLFRQLYLLVWDYVCVCVCMDDILKTARSPVGAVEREDAPTKAGIKFVSQRMWFRLCRKEMRIYYKLIKHFFFFFDTISLDCEAFI